MRQINPDRIEPLKSEVVCKKYLKPERVGSIYLPSTALEDKTGTLWEVVKSNEKADEIVGAALQFGDVLRIRWGTGATDLGVDDPADRRRLYLIPAEIIQHRTVNTWTG